MSRAGRTLKRADQLLKKIGERYARCTTSALRAARDTGRVALSRRPARLQQKARQDARLG